MKDLDINKAGASLVILKEKSEVKKKEKKLLEPRKIRSPMDPQQKKVLDMDLSRLFEFGDMSFNSKGLLSFNRFMHLFALITRHSKE